MDLLHQEAKLNEIVLLVGEEVLPDDQRLVLSICHVLKVGFLQQNAFHPIDCFVPLTKQYQMLSTIDHLYEAGKEAVANHIPIGVVKNQDLYSKVIGMKYNIANDDDRAFVDLNNEITNFYQDLIKEYRG